MLYEIVGLNREEVRRLTDELCGAAEWDEGHAWINKTCVARPQGCQCARCKRLERPSVSAEANHE
jgi:hypothetical protein